MTKKAERKIAGLKRAAFAVCLSGLTGVVAMAATVPEGYPNRSIRLVNPFAPGGIVDTSVRAVLPLVVQAWGQQVVIDNRPGAGTNIGTEIVVRTPPDGYTVLATTGSLATNPHFYPNLPFKPVRDLAPMVLLAQTSGALAIHMGVPAKNLPEFIALARAQPGQLTVASAGTGTSTHLSIELLKSLAKIDVVHVPFKGGGGGIVGVMGGQMAGVMTVLTLVLQQHNTGKIRILAVTSAARNPLAMDIPTFAEAGVPGYESVSWVGLFAPRATQQPILRKWNTEINRAIRDAEVVERYKAAGLIAGGGSEQAFAAFFLKETERWAALIKAAKIAVSP